MEPSVIDDRHAFGIAHEDIERFSLEDSVADVESRLRDSPFDIGAVVNEEGVVLGRVALKDMQGSSATSVADAMKEGPQTVRVDEELPSLVKRMDKSSIDDVFVTDPDGRLLGLVTRADVQAASIHSGA